MRRIFPRTWPAALLLVPSLLPAQTRSFIVRLGVDTFAIERITRRGNQVDGAVARHTPTSTILRYTLRFNPDSSIASYEESIFNPDGTPVPPTPQGIEQTRMKMTFVGDSVIREVISNGQPLVVRNSANRVTLPAVGGTSPYWQELSLQAVRRAGASNFGFYTFSPAQTAPNTFDVRLIGRDSAEILFPQGFRRGFRLDARGQLQHGDATNTTVRLQIAPIHDADIDAIARAWGARDAAGAGMGMPSTRDSVVTMVGTARVSIDYGRPAKRGRVIWGKLVPLDTVWRLGANNPTQLRTSEDLAIGGEVVPAGSYSLWLVPSNTHPLLLVNRQTQGWVGVPMHDAAQDLVAIPVRKHSGPPFGEERFRILVQDGLLLMLWDDGGYEVSIRSSLSR